MKVLVVSGSRADRGLLEMPVRALREAGMLGDFVSMDLHHHAFHAASYWAYDKLTWARTGGLCDMLMVLGDRWEILALVTEAHLRRIPVAHIGGGDVTEGSYDDAMRDAISRMASIHFVTSTAALARLTHMGYRNVHLVGNPGADYIRQGNWRVKRQSMEPYVVVAYYPETIDGTIDLDAVHEAIGGRKAYWVKSNPDAGADQIPGETYSHDDFLNLIADCEEFIGNSSAMLYEAPELGVKTRMIGKRQKGRTIPWSDGHASERIAKILRYTNV